MKTRFIILVVAYVILSAGLLLWTYNSVLETGLRNDRQSGSVRLSEAINRLRGQLDVFKTLTNLTSRSQKSWTSSQFGGQKNIDEELSLLALTYGAWSVDLADQSGRTLYSSLPKRKNFRYPKYLISAALNERIGYAIDIEGSTRLVRFSRRVASSDAASPLVIIVSENLDALEFEWTFAPEPIVFFDKNGVSISSNRPELLLLSKLDNQSDARFPLHGSRNVGGIKLWRYFPASGGEAEVQTISRYVPHIEMESQILLDTSNARNSATLRTGLVAAVLLALALVLAIITQQRRRIKLEAQHSLTLEQRVEARTQELRTAQNELVEASNLAALGRLAAGITHELNQPLAAILNFSENAKSFIQRNKADVASENLSLISGQIHRINRIIKNLRTFARQEHTQTERIDIVEVTNNAIELVKDDLDASGVALDLKLPKEPVYVLAGKVRLEQVVLNLATNAIDAMQSSNLKKLEVLVCRSKGNGTIEVTDTGGGIQNPEKVFEPFYTTKELGSSKGLGMGLALSFGLISRFGGQLSCRNTANGAEFKITLPIMEEGT